MKQIGMIMIMWFFVNCRGEEKERVIFNLLYGDRLDTYEFYQEFAFAISDYHNTFKREPTNIIDIYNLCSEIYRDGEGRYKWLNLFDVEELRIKIDCNNENVIFYFIGPDKVDGSLEKVIKPDKTVKFEKYRKLKGDIFLASVPLIEECK